MLNEIGIRMPLAAERAGAAYGFVGCARPIISRTRAVAPLCLIDTGRFVEGMVYRVSGLRSHKARRNHRCTCPRRDCRRPVPRARAASIDPIHAPPAA
jgi:hypothetical protein